MFKEIYHVKVGGVAPMLHHRYRGNNPEGSKKASQVYDPQVEAEKALYADGDGVPYVPGEWIEAALVRAGASFKYKGRRTYRDLMRSGVRVEPLEIPLPFEWTIDTRGAIVQRNRIERFRPRFDEWEIEFDLVVMQPEVQGAVLREILTEAGDFYGIGDFRPRFGRFAIAEWAKKADDAAA